MDQFNMHFWWSKTFKLLALSCNLSSAVYFCVLVSVLVFVRLIFPDWDFLSIVIGNRPISLNHICAHTSRGCCISFMLSIIFLLLQCNASHIQGVVTFNKFVIVSSYVFDVIFIFLVLYTMLPIFYSRTWQLTYWCYSAKEFVSNISCILQ